MTVLWSVLLHAAFETPITLDERTRRDVLDLGYPLATIAKIEFDSDVTEAEEAVHAVAPNAKSDGASHRLMIAHPFFESAQLSWENTEAGQWRSVSLHFPVEISLPQIADSLMACLQPVVGDATKNISDHLAGTFTLQYKAQGGKPWIDVGEQVLQLYPHYSFGDPATAPGFAEVITALAGCEATE